MSLIAYSRRHRHSFVDLTKRKRKQLLPSLRSSLGLDTTIYSEDGLWLQSYVVEEKKHDEFSERLVMRSVEDLRRLIEHLSKLGFSPEKISVEAMCGGRASQLVEEKGATLVEVTRRRLRKFVFQAYEAASIVTLARDIDSKIQLNKRYHQLAFVEYVYQRYLEKCGRDS